MLASPYDAAAAVVLGVAAAALAKRRAPPAGQHAYLAVTALATLLLWAKAVAANLGGVDHWLLHAGAAEVPLAVWLAYTLSYPLWVRAAGELAFVLVGRRPDQGGLAWVFRLADRTDPIEPAWDAPEASDSEDGPGEGD